MARCTMGSKNGRETRIDAREDRKITAGRMSRDKENEDLSTEAAGRGTPGDPSYRVTWVAGSRGYPGRRMPLGQGTLLENIAEKMVSSGDRNIRGLDHTRLGSRMTQFRGALPAGTA